MARQTSHASELDSAAFDSTEERSGVRERPKKAKRHSLPAYLSQESESDLRRWFRNGGSIATTRSTTAACLQIIEQRKKIAIPCETCGGDVASERPGTGFVNSKTFRRRPDEHRSARRAPPTEKTRELAALVDVELSPAAAAQPLAATTPAQLELPVAFDGDMLCPDCDGRCWLVGAVNARRKGKAKRPIPKASPFRVTRPSLEGFPNAYSSTSQDPPRGYELSEEMHADLTWLGKMSRWMMRLVDLHPEDGHKALEVLGCYAAPDGGNVGALWHLVPAGRTMLRTNPLKLHHSQLFANMRESQRQKFDEKRFLQFEAASAQAIKLFEWACTIWNSASPKVEEEAGEEPYDHEAEVDAALSSLSGPLRVLTNTTTSAAERTDVLVGLSKLGVAALPAGAEIKLINLAQQPLSGAYRDFIEENARDIARAVAGQILPPSEPEVSYDPETKRLSARIPLGMPMSAERAEEWRRFGALDRMLSVDEVKALALGEPPPAPLEFRHRLLAVAMGSGLGHSAQIKIKRGRPVLNENQEGVVAEAAIGAVVLIGGEFGVELEGETEDDIVEQLKFAIRQANGEMRGAHWVRGGYAFAMDGPESSPGGVVRAFAQAALLKRFSEKDWGDYLERTASPGDGDDAQATPSPTARADSPPSLGDDGDAPRCAVGRSTTGTATVKIGSESFSVPYARDTSPEAVARALVQAVIQGDADDPDPSSPEAALDAAVTPDGTRRDAGAELTGVDASEGGLWAPTGPLEIGSDGLTIPAEAPPSPEYSADAAALDTDPEAP